MTGAAEKIKDAVKGGHHDTAAKNESAACEDRGAQHHTGHAHHDPEPEAKKATSAAGNYPYWGNLPRDGQGHGSGIDSREHQHGHSGAGAGALATGAGSGAAGAGYLPSKDTRDLNTREQDPLYASTRDHPTGDRNTGSNSHRREEEALAGGAGIAGAGYLASRDRDDRKDERHPATSSAPVTQSTTTAASSSRHDPQRETQQATSAAGNYPHSNEKGDRRKEEEYLGAGAGAAGLAGAGYLATRDRKDENPTSDSKRVAFSGNTAAPGTQTTTGAPSSGQHHHDPEIDAQKATSAAGNYPHWGGEHNKRDEERLGAGAGAAGLAGAGYYGSKKLDERKDAHQSYPSRETNTTTSTGAPGSFSQLDETRNVNPSASTQSGAYPTGNDNSYRKEEGALAGMVGLGAAGMAGNEEKKRHHYRNSGGQADLAATSRNNGLDERRQEPALGGTSDLGQTGYAGTGDRHAGTATGTNPTGHTGHNHRREEEALAGTAGLGAAGYAGAEAKKHHDEKKYAGGQTGFPEYNSSELTPAQLAAQSAWNQQNPGSTSSDAYPESGNNNLRSDLEYAGAGAGVGAGAAGLASKHGQGRDYGESPRTYGSEGAGYAPSGQIGVAKSSGLESTREPGLASGSTGGLGRSGQQSKPVLHRCEQCGHDNDISRYFNKAESYLPGQ
ncbi:hypothetical protein VP1G_03649 [Cytospora mali]|uniref:Uncharacterized protein n=1 Tax=Cytospora mali TaxID=578113 RepID=A0A194UX43_CYTMA|nr:hypothetical protein VP1G_03649 [Valsa mali var. pyri (nom. inval.)]